MPDLPFYPAVISVSVAVAAAVHHVSGIPMGTALVLILAGVAVAGFVGYRPAAPTSPEPPVAQRVMRRLIARAIRLAIGTAVIALATVAAIRFFGSLGA